MATEATSSVVVAEAMAIALVLSIQCVCVFFFAQKLDANHDILFRVQIDHDEIAMNQLQT